MPGSKTLVRLIVPLVFTLSGCATAPVQEFRDYSDAFAESRAMGEVFLDDVAAAIEFTQRQATSDPGGVSQAYPDSFDPARDVASLSAAEPPSVATRRAAFSVVTDYNDVLLSLAEGRSAEQVSSKVSALGQKVAGFASLLGAASNPLVGVGISALSQGLALAERLRAQREFEQAVLQGYPEVSGIIDAMVADTPTLYRIRKDRYELDLNAERSEANKTLNAIRSLGGSFAAPRDEALVQSRAQAVAETNAALSRILGRVLSEPIPAATARNAPAYDAKVDSTMTQLVANLKQSADRFQQVVKQINAYHSSLAAYVAMLRQAQRGLATVKTVVETPPDPTVAAANLLQTALALRERVNALRAEIKAAK